MKRLAIASLLLAVLPVAIADAATLETRIHTRLKGSLSFASDSIVVTDSAGQKTTVPMSDVARVSFFDAPKAITLTNAPWSSVDIGEVYQPGSTAWTNGALTLTASGWGAWRDADALRLASVPLTGDGEIIARVERFDDSTATVLAGISIREGLAPNARHISLLQSSKGSLIFRARGDEGFTHRTLSVEHSNCWLRITRSGSRLAAYVSEDAKSWSPVEGVSIRTDQELRAGMVVSTEVNTSLGAARFREVTLHQGTQVRDRNELPAPAIVLRDGTILAGVFTATNERVQFERAGAPAEFNINGLAALLFQPVAATIALQPTISPLTGVVMKDRDWLEGEVRDLTPQGIVLATVLFGTKTVRWSDQPAAVILGGRTEGARWELMLKDGSQIRAREFSINGDRGTARTAALAEFPFGLSELLEIRALNSAPATKP